MVKSLVPSRKTAPSRPKQHEHERHYKGKKEPVVINKGFQKRSPRRPPRFIRPLVKKKPLPSVIIPIITKEQKLRTEYQNYVRNAGKTVMALDFFASGQTSNTLIDVEIACPLCRKSLKAKAKSIGQPIANFVCFDCFKKKLRGDKILVFEVEQVGNMSPFGIDSDVLGTGQILIVSGKTFPAKEQKQKWAAILPDDFAILNNHARTEYLATHKRRFSALKRKNAKIKFQDLIDIYDNAVLQDKEDLVIQGKGFNRHYLGYVMQYYTEQGAGPETRITFQNMNRKQSDAMVKNLDKANEELHKINVMTDKTNIELEKINAELQRGNLSTSRLNHLIKKMDKLLKK